MHTDTHVGNHASGLGWIEFFNHSLQMNHQKKLTCNHNPDGIVYLISVIIVINKKNKLHPPFPFFSLIAIQDIITRLCPICTNVCATCNYCPCIKR